jgi:predicted alpha/beta hydrolase
VLSAAHILVLPALGVSAPVYAPLLAAIDALAHTQATLVPLPTAGRGWRAAWAARHLGYHAWLHEIEAQVARLRRAAPERRVLLLGHSIGGQVGLLALARRAVSIDGLVLVASGTPHWQAWPPKAQARLRRGLHVVTAATRLWPCYPGDWLGFGGRQPRRLMLDWLGTARTGGYDAVAGLPGLGAQLQDAQGCVLAIGIEGDALAPPEATRYLLDLAPRLQVQHVMTTSERLRQESPMRRHNLWPRDPPAIMPHLAAWLRARWPEGARTASSEDP